MNFNNTKMVKHLQCTFPKLTETNQFYILGIAEGLKWAQNSKPEEIVTTAKQDSGKQMARH